MPSILPFVFLQPMLEGYGGDPVRVPDLDVGHLPDDLVSRVHAYSQYVPDVGGGQVELVVPV